MNYVNQIGALIVGEWKRHFGAVETRRVQWKKGTWSMDEKQIGFGCSSKDESIS
jgi:hypothetical protein